jgi:hypothetical protein
MSITHVGLSINVGSDPIRGLLVTGQQAPQAFCGWVELAAAIEGVRAGHEPGPRANPRKD